MRKLLTFGIAGLIAQMIDGTLGMGYGVTATSVLVSMGTAAAIASATVHLAEVGTTLASGASHWRFGNVSWRLVARLGVPGAVGAFTGATVLSNVDASGIKPVVSTILLCLGVYVIVRFLGSRPRAAADESALRTGHLAVLGVGAGFLDALGGGGWGPVTSPTLIAFGRQEPRRVIGSVSASEFLVALAASIGFLTSLGSSGISWSAVACLLVGGVVAAPLAAWLVAHVRSDLSGAFVGTAIVALNARTLMLAAGWSVTVRAAVMVGIVGAGAALALRAVALRRSAAEVGRSALGARPDEPRPSAAVVEA